MLTLYYCPGACSMAAHVALEEAGASFESVLVNLRKGEQHAEPFKKINPRGEVPVLKVGDEPITQCVAILAYIGRAFPEAELLPKDGVAEARCISMLSWISNSVDPQFRRMVRPERFVADQVAHGSVKDGAKEGYWRQCQEIDTLLSSQAWLGGNQYTVCDPYALVYYGWAAVFGLPVAELVSYTDHKERLLARPAVRRVLEREKSPLLKTA
ncbi:MULTISPECIES: glutathione S-transferase family protein [unclassified Bradyrhizobium]|uniref:glutathione S-transferase family protein n=1 Tax=unclassified Bradyrhizobium TaxID=2631580 RepID=UPI0024788B62|nr:MULTISPECIES: glutathione S-transferase family protein [unclassified Bradyrhizobium]WGS19886.1 glutathione S-transferase family protein [Bradyrhizobium sp. ISRA463]WGS26740.1 glutathione S-transferase family protein [Bradyrhizobium sp. ISRA464]